MVTNGQEHDHLIVSVNDGFYVSEGYLLDTASNIVVLVDNNGNILTDNAGSELMGYRKGQ